MPDSTREILDCLQNGRPNNKYSDTIRQFAMAMTFYSPNAYRYLRSVFKNKLPGISTIRQWSTTVDGSPGVTLEALETLKIKVEKYKKEGKQLYIALISDEMSIRKKVEWNDPEKKFSGFASCRDDNNNNSDVPVAKDSLVFMAVGDDFKIPVAYYILGGLSALGRAALTQLVIKSMNATGAIVKSLTLDGLKANMTMTNELGADCRNGKPYFPSPTNPEDKIYVIWDAPHMLKLARGCLKHHSLYDNGKPIRWNYVENLHTMQQERNINLGNKLTKMHLDFHVKPMNVRLAAETISKSVAHCIDQLREDGYQEFVDSEATTEYIRYVDGTFDILNFKPNMKGAGKSFKKPLNSSTVDEMFTFFSKAKKYFRSLDIDVKTTKLGVERIDRKNVINSRNSTPYLGLASNLTALEGLYADCVLNGTMNEFYTFKFSQDHLETWFSNVRSALGKFHF